MAANHFGIDEANSLLRSAHAIATRKGERTNWPAFLAKLEKHLVEQAGGDITNPQHVARSTCTPLTFRLCGEEQIHG